MAIDRNKTSIGSPGVLAFKPANIACGMRKFAVAGFSLVLNGFSFHPGLAQPKKNSQQYFDGSQLKPAHGFTLIELLVVISIIGLLASIMMVAFNTLRAKARDAKRLADMKQLTTALQLYYEENQSYPPVDPIAQGVGGWDVSYQPGFLGALVPGFISTVPKDPVNKLDVDFSFFGPKAGSYFYAYYNYPASSAAAYNCPFTSDFAVLTIRQLETAVSSSTPAARCGTPPPGGCSEGGVPGICRDWSTEFDYSVFLVK